MNGAEQKARGGEILRLDRDLKKVEQAALDAFSLEVDARREAIEGVKALIARMIDDETQFRNRALAAMNSRLTKQMHYDETAFAAFVSLVWWRRYLWCIFGVRPLGWFKVGTPTVPTTAATTTTTMGQPVTYRGEKPH